MQILHLSDLHITKPHDSLEKILIQVVSAITDSRFDFIVVSGDLSQRADSAEYRELKRLSKEHLIPLLKQKNKRRLIFVPGNHDVDWGHKVGEPISLVELGSDAKKISQKIADQATQGEYRQCIGEYGHFEFRKLDESIYPERFTNIQTFFDTFYGETQVPHKNFSLLESAEQGNDWSAHIFHEQKVAFFGFNSSFRNDKFWQGATLNPYSIAKAKKHAEKHCGRDYLKVAIWHHGLQSDSRREDYLLLPDLAVLHGAGFRVGFHGHTHKNEIGLLDEFVQDSFAIAAIGSIGAGAKDRPEAVGNQFSVVNLYPNQLHVNLFEAQTSGSYLQSEKTRSVYMLQESSNSSSRPSARRHSRSYKIDSHGLTEVKVVIEHLRVEKNSPVVAVVTPPACRIRSGGDATTPEGHNTVRKKVLGPSKCIQFVVERVPSFCKRLEWKYFLSNGFALNHADIEARTAAKEWISNLPTNYDGRPHTVRIRCEELILRTELPKEVTIENVQALVERQNHSDGEQHWDRVESEEARCLVKQKRNVVELRVDCPIPDYRYSAVYKIKDKGKTLTAFGNAFCTWLVEECRSASSSEPSLPKSLTSAVDKNLEDLFMTNVDSLHWIGLIWRPLSAGQPHTNKLLGAFGRFPNWQWSTEYARGAGVAGHAFRFSNIATWSVDRKDKENLIFIPPPKSASRQIDWIVCAPLLVGRDGPSVGVISFEGTGAAGTAAANLKRLAIRTDYRKERKFEQELWTALNQAFWTALSLHSSVDRFHKRFAKNVIKKLGLGSKSTDN